MGIAIDMKKLTQDITSAHGERANRITEIREGANQTRGDARNQVADFQISRRGTSTRFRRELTKDKQRRKSETSQILKEAQKILKANQTSRQEASAQLQESLSTGATNRRSEVKETLKGFITSRKKMTFELMKDLDQSRSNVKSAVVRLLSNTRTLVKGLRKTRRDEGKELRKGLAKNRAGRESQVRQMRSNIRKARANIRSELRNAEKNWQDLVRGRTVFKTKIPAPEKGATDFEGRLLGVVNAHPEGITLAEIADNLGVASIVMGRASRKLLDKGKIRKVEKLYFPASE